MCFIGILKLALWIIVGGLIMAFLGVMFQGQAMTDEWLRDPRND